MSTTNVTIDQLFSTIGRLHIQVEAAQSEIAKRDAIIAQFMKEKEATKAAQVPPPPEPPSPELIDKVRTSTPDA